MTLRLNWEKVGKRAWRAEGRILRYGRGDYRGARDHWEFEGNEIRMSERWPRVQAMEWVEARHLMKHLFRSEYPSVGWPLVLREDGSVDFQAGRDYRHAMETLQREREAVATEHLKETAPSLVRSMDPAVAYGKRADRGPGLGTLNTEEEPCIVCECAPGERHLVARHNTLDAVGLDT